MADGASAIYVDMLRLAPLAADVPRYVARIVDYDDLLSERYRLAAANDYDVMGFLSRRVGPLARVARLASAPLLRAESERCAAYERELAQTGDLILFTSAREAAALAAPHVMAAPPMMAPRRAAPAPGRRLIFLGNMRYAENVTMLRALAGAVDELRLQNAWPADAVIEAVGDHPEELPRAFDASFAFSGRIDDLDALAGAGIFLAPVVSGSGVKIKVLDGMALGCPVVATPKALEGLSARANRDLIVAATPVDVLSAALRLRDRPALKSMLAARARAYLERAHSTAIGETLCDAIEAAIARRQETL
jgi:glycosyltransferase involved in cell wall biosynthesis